MELALNKNLNNLNLFWQALNANFVKNVFTHASWPNKKWYADFTKPIDFSNLALPINKTFSTIADLNNSELTDLVIKNQLIVMYLPLEGDGNQQRLAGDIHPNIVKLDNESDATLWAKACGLAFGYEIDAHVIYGLLKNPNASVFAYMQDKQIAGTAISFRSGDTLGIHQLGTVPGYRKMGIAASIMQHLIAQAYGEKKKLISLQASQAGLPLYESLGFKIQGKLTSLMAAV